MLPREKMGRGMGTTAVSNQPRLTNSFGNVNIGWKRGKSIKKIKSKKAGNESNEWRNFAELLELIGAI
jgi:hypothetical protein